ncbi:MAG: class I SAM-dependent methyltransferase [Cyclobacteriaceae bacterium]|nr:class I SAM-dependent methyltransferase [Cyclobacteriaceae bacterium]
MKGIINSIVEWDVINWSKALDHWERNVFTNEKKLTCLELGGRRGGLSLWLATKGNEVICSDYENPEPIASKIHKEHSFIGTISYQAIDATQIPYEDYFDIIVFKSILGGISRNGNSHLNQKVIDEVFKALKPGGKLLFAENLEASAIHRFFRKRLTRWGKYWNYLTIDEVPMMFKKYENVSFESVGFLGAFGRNEWQRSILGHLDTVIFDKFLSRKMRYVVFGVATKPKE